MGPARKVAARDLAGRAGRAADGRGGTDGAFLTPAGIPTYGVSGIFADPEGSHAHGLERAHPGQVADGGPRVPLPAGQGLCGEVSDGEVANSPFGLTPDQVRGASPAKAGVEALSFCFRPKRGKGFDKLSPNENSLASP